MTMLCRLAALALAALCVAAAPAAAQDYPNRPVRVLVGFTPGAAADITARVLGTRLSQILGQQIVVENKPGAGSNLAADYVSHAAKDGYTLLIGTSANLTNAVITQGLAFDFVKDFAPIALIATAPVILVAHPSLEVNSVQQLIALAKKKPGELNYASTGVGAAPHLAGELFNARAGIKIVHVPYQGTKWTLANFGEPT
jgi:tripartite-type tricarboxylate transporter receptor subunit TctC